MSPKKLALLSVVMLAFLFLTTGLVFSQMVEREKPSKPGLGLTPEQKEKIRSIAFEGKKEQIRLQSDLGIANLELRELMTQEKLDKAKINRKLDEIGALRTKLEKAKVDRLMTLRDVLTKEQLQGIRERRLHRMLSRRVIEKRIRLNEGRLQRFQSQRTGPGPLSEEPAPVLPQQEEVELSIAPEELPAEPELVLLEEELAPLFDEVEPAPPMEEFQPLPDEAPLPEDLQ
ncbi:MAG: periplasmic heavy metal sensor [candidate division Zixibacteria bacterium]|nr:periplasmic heavy metal sensor [candidate division Zixibacteria bacterium]